MKLQNLIVAAALAVLSGFTAKAAANARTIAIAGLIVDAQTMQPLESAEVDDVNGNRLGVTDKNGYYKISFNVAETGDIKFGVKIKKEGYRPAAQNDHWGDLPDGFGTYFYFGLQKNGSNVKSFSQLGRSSGGNHALDYDGVMNGFKKVHADNTILAGLEKAKQGNENVLFQVAGKYYVVDAGGWIALDSDKDMVSVDDKKLIRADELNAVIKRKNIHSMTTVDAADHKVAVYTGDNFKAVE